MQVGILKKKIVTTSNPKSEVYYFDLYGERNEKYSWLSKMHLNEVVSLKDLGRKLASEKESINEYTDYSFMKFLALGKTDALSCQPFNSCS